MVQHEITGLGPKNPDGSVKIFTRLPSPFVVTAAWLAEQSKAPAVGDVIEVSTQGALTLVTETQAVSDEAAEAPDAANAEKKSLGSAESGSGSELSPFREFEGKPVLCHAAPIAELGETHADGSIVIIFADGSDKLATPEMLSRIKPELGDYWVIASQGDGVYEYLNPKALFEAKYHPYVKE